MERKTYKNWCSHSGELLDANWLFSNLINKKSFDRGFIGELLVLDKLLRTYKKELSSKDGDIVYAGSVNKGWDIELKLKKKIIHIDVKATRVKDGKKQPKWVRPDAKAFCNIQIGRNARQQVSLKKNKECKPDLFYVYVNVLAWVDGRTPQFFTLSDKNASRIFGKKYRKYYHKEIRESRSTNFWVEYNDVRKFKDNKLLSFRGAKAK